MHEPLTYDESKSALFTPQFLGFLGKTGQKFLILPILTQMLGVHAIKGSYEKIAS